MLCSYIHVKAICILRLLSFYKPIILNSTKNTLWGVIGVLRNDTQIELCGDNRTNQSFVALSNNGNEEKNDNVIVGTGIHLINGECSYIARGSDVDNNVLKLSILT